MNNDLISREALKEIRFKSNRFIQIGGRTNGKTLENVSAAYQMGWNDAIDTIIDNAPTVEEKPKGTWESGGFCFSTMSYKCPFCKSKTLERTKFCSECGADMRGDNND